MSDTTSANTSTNTNTPPSAPPSSAPKGLDLSHEPEAIRQIMQSREYWSENQAVRREAADRVYAIRQSLESKAEGGDESTPADRMDGFGKGPTSDVTQPIHDLSGFVAPAEFQAEAAGVWKSIATDVGIGGKELSAVAREAVPFLQDNTVYTYESGDAALREQVGDRADEVLRDAKRFIEEYPGLLRVLKQRHLANHPGVIQVLASRWKARDGVQAKLKALRSNPQYLQLRGEHDHEEQARLAREVEFLMGQLHG
jgi:hypothetical protein